MPARTSEASSLKRRRDSSSPSKITMSSRSTRIGRLRCTTPSITMQPAIAPNFGERNTSRTSAIPRIFSRSEDNDVFTQYTDWTVTVHNTFDNHATGDRAKFRRAEHVTHLGDTQDILPNVAAKHAGKGFLDVFDDVVDDVVVTHVQAFLLDDLASASIGTHVEAEQYSVGSQCQVSVGLGDTTDTATDDTHFHFVVTQAVQGAVQRFEGTTNVRFEDDVERLLLCLAHVLEDVFQLAGVSASQFDFAELALTEQSHFTGFLLVRQHAHLVASVRGTVQAEDLDRDGRTGFLDLLAVLVEHGTYTAVVRTDQHHVALTQGAVLNQNGCNRATTFVETRLNHNTATWGRWRCFQFEYFSLQQDRFEQFVHASTDFRRNRNERR